jgi:hypothetical protein
MLDLGFVEPVVLVDLGADDHPGAGEAGDLGVVAGERLLHEEAVGGGGGVVAEDPGEGFEEYAFAVAAGAVGEGQDVGADDADGGVADEALQVGDEVLVVAEGVGEELVPAAGVGGGVGVHQRWTGCTALRGRAGEAVRCAGR